MGKLIRPFKSHFTGLTEEEVRIQNLVEEFNSPNTHFVWNQTSHLFFGIFYEIFYKYENADESGITADVRRHRIAP